MLFQFSEKAEGWAVLYEYNGEMVFDMVLMDFGFLTPVGIKKGCSSRNNMNLATFKELNHVLNSSSDAFSVESLTQRSLTRPTFLKAFSGVVSPDLHLPVSSDDEHYSLD